MFKLFIRMAAILTLAGMMAAGFASAGDQTNSCISCHSELDEGEEGTPTEQFTHDVHNREGLGCAGCHGGDPTSDDMDIAMSEEKGFIGAPDATEIPNMCSKCHSDPTFMKKFNPGLSTDQYAKYLTSVHGKLNRSGDTKVAECASCHSAHSIRTANDPKSTIYAPTIPHTCGHCHSNAEYMAEYGIPTNQEEEYSRSVHGIALLEKKDLGAPACNDCHGNHGAVPPEVGSIDRVCGLCHANNMNDFEQSTHADYFAMTDEPACELCHSNHLVKSPTSSMLLGDNAVCLQCHDMDDGTGGMEAAKDMGNDLDSLSNLIAAVNNHLDEADQKGLYVNQALFTLKDARQKMFLAKTAIHTFEAKVVDSITTEGDTLAIQASNMADDLLKDYTFRRQGLAVSVLLLCLLSLFLWLKARQLEQRKKSTTARTE
jgi:hypothetical protein